MEHPSEEDSEFRLIQWQGLSDLFLTCFIVAMALVPILWYIGIPKKVVNEELQDVAAVGVRLERIRVPVNIMRDVVPGRELLRNTQTPDEVLDGLEQTSLDVVSIIEEVHRLQEKLTIATQRNVDLGHSIDQIRAAVNDRSPMISIEEGGKQFRFEDGEAILDPEWIEKLGAIEFKNVANEVIRRKQDKLIEVDTILVIGHTDGNPVTSQGNLDKTIFGWLGAQNQPRIESQAGSNADLGLMRAMAVAKAWKNFASAQPQTEILSTLKVRCLSAGPTEPVDSSILLDEKAFHARVRTSRRVEIRLIKN